MRPLLYALVLCLLPAAAQADVITLDLEDAKPGRYSLLLEVSEDGTVTARSLPIVTVNGRPAPPNDPPPPEPPVTLKTEVTRQARAVIGDSTEASTTALELAQIYKFVAKKVGDGEVSGPDGLRVVSRASDALLSDEEAAIWKPFRDWLSGELTRRAQRGNLDYADAIQQIADGLLEASSNAERLDIGRIIKIIELVMEILRMLDL